MNRSRRAPPSPLQSLMQEWSALAPYNFIHALRLAAPVDVERWQIAIRAAIAPLGIMPDKAVVECAATDFETHIKAELQRPFSTLDVPLRFFLLEEKTGSHWFGVVLDHWFADDFSCRRLLHRVYASYQTNGDEAHSAPLEPMPYRAMRCSRWRQWCNFVRQAMLLRRAARTSLRDALDFSVDIFRAAPPEAALPAIQQLGKAHGVTVHDILLGATAQAFAAARTAPDDGRDAVAIISAMDLRRFEPEPQRSAFGLHLGHYTIVVRRPDQPPLVELSKAIAGQTRRLKAAPGTELLPPALWLWRLSRSRHAKATFFQRGAPLVAGVSNVNLTGSWIEQSDIHEYRRIGPTGPVVPMVLMITTLRGRMFFDVTFRSSAFKSVEAHSMVEDLIRRLPGAGGSGEVSSR